MNRQELMSILPHRPPMLLVDEAHIDVRRDASGEYAIAVGSYAVRGDEFFLQGHFPGQPVVPGVILCEMMGQTSCVLMADGIAGKTTLFAGLDKVRFRRTVVPGDTVVFTSRQTAAKGAFHFIEGIGTVGDVVCVTAELSFALVDPSQVRG